MSHAVDTWYVLADGTHALPGDVSPGKDGKLVAKNGVAVALRENGHPLTSGVATKTNKQAAEAGKAAEADAKKATADDAAAAKRSAAAADDREVKAAADKTKYQTR